MSAFDMVVDSISDMGFDQTNNDECTDNNGIAAGAVEQSSSGSNSAAINKEMLRKIKRRERTKLHKQKKRALQKNFKNLNATMLQQSVASLTTCVGGDLASSCTVNDPLSGFYHQQTVDTSQKQFFEAECDDGIDEDISTTGAVPTGAAVGFHAMSKPLFEVPVCIMDSSNLNARLSNHDLIYINESLEKALYNDLTVAPKLRIANTYLSTSHRVWVICHSQFAVNWVIRKVSAIPALNGRTFIARTMLELDVMSQVTVFVPKECTMVENFNDLMRFLMIQNPSLSQGTVKLDLRPGGRNVTRASNELNPSAVEALMNEPNSNEVDLQDSAMTTAITPNNDAQVKLASASVEGGSNATASVTCPALQVEKPIGLRNTRKHSFTFYADDTWLTELHRLGYRPYLGMRRLLCVVGQRIVQGKGREISAATAAAVKKKRRGGKKSWDKFNTSRVTTDNGDATNMPLAGEDATE